MSDENLCGNAKRLFPLGEIVATIDALDTLGESDTNAVELLHRHQLGDWGDLEPEDAERNLASIHVGARIFSNYTVTRRQAVWVITEGDRSVTVIMLPEQFR